MQLAFNADVTDDADAEELHAAAVPLLERAGRRRDVAILQLNRGVTHMVRGRWPAALAMFDLAADGFRRCGFVLGSLSTDANRGGLLLEQGHPARGGRAVRRRGSPGLRRREHPQGAVREGVGPPRTGLGRARPTGAIEGSSSASRRTATSVWHSEADGLDAYLVEVLVLDRALPGGEGARRQRCCPAWPPRSSEVVVLTTRRLAAVAKHFLGDPVALDELRHVLDAARADDCAIEIARCLQALELCSPTIDEAWAQEREERCRELGVTWMPPVTFARVD